MGVVGKHAGGNLRTIQHPFCTAQQQVSVTSFCTGPMSVTASFSDGSLWRFQFGRASSRRNGEKTGAETVAVVAVAAAAAPAAAVPAGKVRALFRAKTTTVIERVASRLYDLQRPIKSLPAGGSAVAFEICRHSARTSQGRCPLRILK